MSNDIYVKVEPIGPTTPCYGANKDTNRVVVTVDYSKGRGIVASAYPAEVKPNGIVIIGVTSGEYVKFAPAARLNRKQVDLWLATAENHIAAKTDIVWDLVLRVCKERGLRPIAE
jgi:hypothetical protein